MTILYTPYYTNLMSSYSSYVVWTPFIMYAVFTIVVGIVVAVGKELLLQWARRQGGNTFMKTCTQPYTC